MNEGLRCKIPVLSLSVAFLALSAPGWADPGIDDASTSALLQTQQMLRDSQSRSQVTSQTPQAAFVDKQAQQLAGNPENVNAIYGLSADILGSLVQQTNGDPAKMKALLDQAKDDPKGFAEKFTPEQRAQLEALARRIPASAGMTAPVSPSAPKP